MTCKECKETFDSPEFQISANIEREEFFNNGEGLDGEVQVEIGVKVTASCPMCGEDLAEGTGDYTAEIPSLYWEE